MTVTSPNLEPLLACPACGAGPLVAIERAWHCDPCAVGFPAVGEIPWLVKDPDVTIGAWRLRLARLVTHLDAEAAAIDAELADTTLPGKTRSRLKLMAGARRDHARRLQALLAPLAPERVPMPESMLAGFGAAVPLAQDLTSYYVNVHRDWVWGEEENRRALELVTRALGSHRPQRVLVLGSGAGRLAYDLHEAWSPAVTIAADLNPLLQLLAHRMFRGQTVELYEFPIAPRTSECSALLRRLAAPAEARAGLVPVFADATALPFAAGAFDTVVTPWLIDILETQIETVLEQINRALCDGGLWINTGSLVFARPQAAAQLSLEEVLDRIEHAGFARPQPTENEVPYMRSPASRHARLETVVTFGTTRQRSSPIQRAASVAPPWIADERAPIPRSAEVEFAAVTSRIHAFVLSLIDGRRSQADLVELLVEQRLMTREDARAAIRTFMERMHQEQSRPRWS